MKFVNDGGKIIEKNEFRAFYACSVWFINMNFMLRLFQEYQGKLV